MSRNPPGAPSFDNPVSGDSRPACSRLDYSEAVLEVVRLVPAGRVVTYGDVAELLESGGPRQVGAAMSRGGDDVPWWRVLRAGGLPPRGLADRALEHYLREDTPLRHTVPLPVQRPAGRPVQQDEFFMVDLGVARWVPAALDFEAVAGVRACLEPVGTTALIRNRTGIVSAK